VALDPVVGAVRCELSRHELAAIVHAQHTELAATLLRSGLMALDGFRSSCLGVEEDRPHVAGDVDEDEEVAPASRSSRCDGTV